MGPTAHYFNFSDPEGSPFGTMEIAHALANACRLNDATALRDRAQTLQEIVDCITDVMDEAT